jgi:hypothetical protein
MMSKQLISQVPNVVNQQRAKRAYGDCGGSDSDSERSSPPPGQMQSLLNSDLSDFTEPGEMFVRSPAHRISLRVAGEVVNADCCLKESKKKTSS